MRTFIIILLIGLSSIQLQAQKRQFNYETSLTGFAATGKTLPFWMISNQHGLIPNGQGGMYYIGLFSDFTPKHKIQFAYGISVSASLSEANDHIILDQIYISSQWRNLRLDLGMIHPEEEFNGISSTNGNIVLSGNSRTFPGYNLRTDYMNLPIMKGIFKFKFNWADYLMVDKNSYVKDIRLHNKSLFIKISPHQRWEFIFGLEHWAQWAGTSPTLGKQPSSFKDYLRIVIAKSGGETATYSDLLNALGNHLGREHMRINYIGDKYMLSFYHDIPWEDASGTDFRSFPDGTYSLYYTSKNPRQWITDIIYEFYYTKYQSGSIHDRPATPEEIAKQDPSDPFYGRRVLGGRDNYFNHGCYRNGWTLHYRTIGSPLITSAGEGHLGVINNRIIGHHIGVKGLAFNKIPYKAMFTYTINYGTYDRKLTHAPRQCSGGLNIILPFRKLPFQIETGIYADYGQFLQDNIGITIKITRQGIL